MHSSPAESAERQMAYGVTGNDSALTLVGNRGGESVPFTTFAASGAPAGLALATTLDATGENDVCAITTAADGAVYAVGWSVDPSTGVYDSEALHDSGGTWTLDTAPDPGNGTNGFAGVAAVPGGGVWAVGVTSNTANNSTLIAYHC